MLPLPVFSLIRYIAAGLVLLLAGCRSSAIVPRFAVAAEARPPRPVQRFDTATAVTAQEFPGTSQRRVKAQVRPLAEYTLNDKPLAKKEQTNRVDSRYPKATTKDSATSLTRPLTSRELRNSSSPKLLSAQTLVHYSLHFAFPAVLALVFFPLMWQTAYLIMLATMLMDVDHLLATPVFDPLRCSVGYHPLHSSYAIPVYALMLLLPATQIAAVGMLFHLFTDTVDCLWSFRHCHECYVNSRIRVLADWVRKILGRKMVG
jgi:hypothetical protein